MTTYIDARPAGPANSLVGISAPINLLLIEDNSMTSRLLSAALVQDRTCPIAVVHVTCLASALIELEKSRFDVVLCDLGLPDSQGLETFLKVHQAQPEIPIIVLSGTEDQETAHRAVLAGADDFLMKGWAMEGGAGQWRAAVARGSTDSLVKGQTEPAGLMRSIRLAIDRRVRPGVASTSKVGQIKEARAGRVLGFIGARGGVGTTTVVLNLAEALTLLQKSVIAAELKPSAGAFGWQVHEAPAHHLGELANIEPDRITDSDVAKLLIRLPSGLRLLMAPAALTVLTELDPIRVNAVVRTLSRMGDLVLLDLPSQPTPASQQTIRGCDMIFLLVEPEPGCMEAAKAWLSLLSSWQVSKRQCGLIVVNRSALTTPIKAADIGTLVGAPLFGMVPSAPGECAAAIAKGVSAVLLYPDRTMALGIEDLGRRLSARTLTPLEF